MQPSPLQAVPGHDHHHGDLHSVCIFGARVSDSGVPERASSAVLHHGNLRSHPLFSQSLLVPGRPDGVPSAAERDLYGRDLRHECRGICHADPGAVETRHVRHHRSKPSVVPCSGCVGSLHPLPRWLDLPAVA